MSTCVPSHALLSALVRRIEKEAHVPPDGDIAALLDLGIPEAEIAAAIEPLRTGASSATLAALRRVAAGRGAPLVLGPEGLPAKVDNTVIARARDHFEQKSWVRLKGFFSPSLLDIVTDGSPDSGFAPKEHGFYGSELCLQPCALTDRLMHLLNSPHLFGVIDAITGCGTIGCFEGRIYRLVPGAGHRDEWHSDMVMGRLVALSVNVGRERYEGGELALRSARTGELMASVPNVGPGDAILFRLSHDLEHRVSDMRGTVPKTAYAGWFRIRPAFEDVVAGRCGF